MAGFTTVSATVLDPNSVPYANGTWTANFFDPGTPGKTPLINGSIITRVYAGDMDSFGSFTVSLPDNAVIASQTGAINTQWIFTFTAKSSPLGLGAAPAFATGGITITGAAQNISATVQAAAATFPVVASVFPVNISSPLAPTGAINGVNTTFTLPTSPGPTVLVIRNGVLQNPGGGNDYTRAGVTITFNSAPLTNDSILVIY